jgi:hypothetical protein
LDPDTKFANHFLQLQKPHKLSSLAGIDDPQGSKHAMTGRDRPPPARFSDFAGAFLLFEAPVDQASEYRCSGTCNLCGQSDAHVVALGIAADVIADAHPATLTFPSTPTPLRSHCNGHSGYSPLATVRTLVAKASDAPYLLE